MNNKVMTTTVNADGETVTIIADTPAALATAVTAKKLDSKPKASDIKNRHL